MYTYILLQYNLGLVFHTIYSGIFHPCYLLLHFPLLHFSPLLSTCNFARIAFSTPAFSVAPSQSSGWLGRLTGDEATCLGLASK